MDMEKAFATVFRFNIFNFKEAYENSCVGCLLNNLEEAREMKSAYEYLKEKFGWKVNFSIYKYNYCCRPMYAVERDDVFKMNSVEKIE